MAGKIRVLLLAAWVVVLGASLSSGHPGDLEFSTQCVEENTYTEFIKALRTRLIRGVSSVYDIPVLNHTVPDSQRFLLVDLSNYAHTIIVAIDVVNANVVAYSAGDQSYFFQDTPAAASNTLFPNSTTQTTFVIESTYAGLEEAANQTRDQIPLGISPLDSAISQLSYSDSVNSVAASMLVVIQMFSDAARFRFIEARVRSSIRNRFDFKPDPAMLSLENNWVSLSLHIQSSVNGVFSDPVQLRNRSNLLVTAASVTSIYVKGIAFLLYKCNVAAASSYIVMSVAVDGDICQKSQSTPVRINGWNGLCVDVRDGRDNNGNPIQLWPCGSQRNQQWTFHANGTIQSLGKCLTTYGYSAGNYIMIFDCRTAVPEATQWKLFTNGTIINPRSGLVLAAPKSQSGTTLTVERNNYTVGQSWGVGKDVEPVVTQILGFKGFCMQVSQNKTSVWMEKCVFSNEQRWAIYGDGTIRVNGDNGLCLTSNGSTSGSLVVISACQGGAHQRWLFKNDGSLLNPGSGLAMDVRGSDVSLRQIILYPPTGNGNQQWLAAF